MTSGDPPELGGLDQTEKSGRHPAPLPSLELERYTLVERLGSGAMGDVWRAHDTLLDRPVALKVLKQTEATGAVVTEARALARISHAHVLPVFDVGTLKDGRVFLATELAPGGTLRQWVAREKPPRARIVEAYRQAGQGLAAAHEAGLVHRDFKPDNVLLLRDGRPAVADFGLAVRGDARGEVAGTPAYMPPEQFEGHADAKSDQFSFCAALFEAVTGSRPFQASTVGQHREAVARGPDPQKLGRLPRWLAKALARGLSAAPEARFSSMTELLSALDRTPARRAALAAVAVGIAALAVGGTVATRTVAELKRCDAAAAAEQVLPASVAERLARLPEAVPLAKELEGLARAWSADRRAVCLRQDAASALSPRDAEVAARCLDQRAGAVRSLVAALMEHPPSHDELRTATRLVRQSGGSGCLTLATSTAPRIETELPAEVLGATTAQRLGRNAEALALLDPFLSRDGGLEPRAELAARLVRGAALQAQTRSEPALLDFAKAAAAAEAAQDDAARATAVASGLYIRQVVLHQTKEAAVALEAARPLITRAGPASARSMLGFMEALSLEEEGKDDEATALIEKCVALDQEAEEPLRELNALAELLQIAARRPPTPESFAGAAALFARAEAVAGTDAPPDALYQPLGSWMSVLEAHGRSDLHRVALERQRTLVRDEATPNTFLRRVVPAWQLARVYGDDEAARSTIARVALRDPSLGYLDGELAIVATELTFLSEGPSAGWAVLSAERGLLGSERAWTLADDTLLPRRVAAELERPPKFTAPSEESPLVLQDLALAQALWARDLVSRGAREEARKLIATIAEPTPPSLARTLPEWAEAVVARERARAALGDGAQATRRLAALATELSAGPSSPRSRALTLAALATLEPGCARVLEAQEAVKGQPSLPREQVELEALARARHCGGSAR